MIKKSIAKGQEKLIDTGFLDGLGQDKDAVKLNKTTQTLIGLAGEFIEKAGENLDKAGSIASGKLANDMYQEITAEKSFIETAVYIEAYGKFVDEGVNGVKRNLGSRFSFKDLSTPKGMINSLRKRAIRSNLRSSAVKRKIGLERNPQQTSQDAARQAAVMIKMFGIKPRRFATDARAHVLNLLNDAKIAQAFKADIIAVLPDGTEFK